MNDDKTSSDCGSKAKKPTTECSRKMPTVAIVNERIEEGHLRATMLDKGDSICKKGNELIKRIDHEKKLRVSQGESYQKGFVNGMQKQKERFSQLIKDKIKDTEINPVDEEKSIKQSEVLQELLDEIQEKEKDSDSDN